MVKCVQPDYDICESDSNYPEPEDNDDMNCCGFHGLEYGAYCLDKDGVQLDDPVPVCMSYPDDPNIIQKPKPLQLQCQSHCQKKELKLKGKNYTIIGDNEIRIGDEVYKDGFCISHKCHDTGSELSWAKSVHVCKCD